jgi:phosphoribosylglycinamide formyltransferase-1
MRRVRTAVLISGNGSNLQALIDAARDSSYPAEIVLVVSNYPQAYGLIRAQAAGIATAVIVHGEFPTREAFDRAITHRLVEHRVECVCLAGFMRILSQEFSERWQGRMMNIHPSLLPKYKGLDTHARVLAAGDTEHGATVHWVTPELDSGEIIAQQAIPVLREDTVESLRERVHDVEHQIYPPALARVATLLLERGDLGA